MLKRVHFRPSVLPFLLVAPQIFITIVFFIWPAGQALFQSVLLEDPFGLSTRFVWFDNFTHLLNDSSYYESVRITVVFSFLVATVGLAISLLLALAVIGASLVIGLGFWVVLRALERKRLSDREVDPR